MHAYDVSLADAVQTALETRLHSFLGRPRITIIKDRFETFELSPSSYIYQVPSYQNGDLDMQTL